MKLLNHPVITFYKFRTSTMCISHFGIAVRCTLSSLQRYNQHCHPYIKNFRRFSGSGGNTYYDSQSGMHVDVHNEDEVSAFVFDRNNTKHWSSLSDEKNIGILTSFLQNGFSGAIQPKYVDLPHVESWAAEVPLDFALFVWSKHAKAIQYPEKVCLIFPFQNYDPGSLTTDISEAVKRNCRTSLLLDSEKEDPVVLASEVASLLDHSGGCDLIWLMSEENDMTQLVEELSYLDVKGPTMKSRLVVEATTDALLEEYLEMGVNKFLLSDSHRISWLCEKVVEQGKQMSL